MSGVPADRVPEPLIDAMFARLRDGLRTTPASIGKYRITGVLGEGGMGRVLLGCDGERQVAIKTLGREWRGSSEAIARFEREARCMAALQHAGVCRVLDWVMAGETPYLVLEYIEGETLAQKLRDARMNGSNEIPAETWVEWVEKAARALHAAHRQGMVHRDVKPGNIMVRPDGAVVLLDFGVAWNAQAPLQDLAGSQLGVGTRPYMAPEQIKPQGWPDARTDVWALGVTLYEVLHHEQPFQAATPHDLAEMILHSPVPKAQRCGRLSRRDLDSVLASAMAKDPARRYPSALEFAQDLQRLRCGAAVLARPQGAMERAMILAQRRPGLAVGCMALALLVAGSFLWFANIAEARSTTLEWRWEARCWQLREEILRQRETYETLWPPESGQLAGLASTIRRWLHGEATNVKTLADSLQSDLANMEPASAETAAAEIAAARAFEQEEVELARERANWWEAEERAAAEDPGGRWAAAIAANPGVLEKPQLGLVPLGPDPSTKLWEFAHRRSGQPPQRHPSTGRLVITRESGLVFVLVPGGDFQMGGKLAQIVGAGRARLGAFFLSKYEMSRDQWARLAQQWPQRIREEEARSKDWSDPCVSRMAASPFGAEAVLPVFHVGWRACEDLLHRDGLQLPTEAQWEMAGRAGAGSEENRTLGREAANFRGGCSWRDHEDGPMPVDSLLPNAFGFHHMAGNVWEWCRDYSDALDPIGKLRDGDGLQIAPEERKKEFRTDRGDAYDREHVGIFVRNVGDSRCVWNNEGVRPVRAVDR
ncbi:MAG TPA: bifunctional serine/threonine-protein kinase/formylglycine-generating enzyme family protein [Planctomycetota bacterium]